MYDEYNQITKSSNFYDMPQYVDHDNDDVFQGFGEGFENEMLSSEGSVFNEINEEVQEIISKGKGK